MNVRIWTIGVSTVLAALLVGCPDSNRTPSPQPNGPKAPDAPKTADQPAKPDKTVTPPDSTKSPTAAGPSAAAPFTAKLSTKGLPTSGNWKCDPIFADVNGDGHLDMAGLPRLGDSAHVWLGNGKGEWTDSSKGLQPQKTPCGGGIVFGDANNDGKLDLFVADHCHGVQVFLGDGAGHWQSAAVGLHPKELITKGVNPDDVLGAECITVGDVNGDGNVDLVVGASDSGGLQVYLGDGTGRNWTRQQGELPTAGWVLRARLFDVNKDGALDLAATASEGPRVWLGDGKGGWKPSSTGFPTPTQNGIYTGLAIGDVNEDGQPDLVVGNWVDGPEVYLQQADGSWRKTPDAFPQMLGGAWGVSLGDIDGDGHLDICVAGRLTREVGFVYGVYVLRGDGRGGWTYMKDTGLPSEGLMYTWGTAIADVNADGAPDIAAASGGQVANDLKRNRPSLEQRMLVWLTQRKK